MLNQVTLIGTPKYLAFADLLENEIRRGTYQDRIPSIKELEINYGLSKITVNKALDLLERENVIAVTNRGIYVNQDSIREPK